MRMRANQENDQDSFKYLMKSNKKIAENDKYDFFEFATEQNKLKSFRLTI